jgi:membrane fusion protein, multidrug efflux system
MIGRIILGTVLVAASVSCNKPEAKALTRPPVPVELGAAERRDVPIRLLAVGNTAASELVVVRPQVGAVLTAVCFTEGDAVEAGQVLFELDGRPFAAVAAQAEAELVRAKASERQVQAVLERDRIQLALASSEDQRTTQLGSELASERQIESTRSLLDQAKATMVADEAAVDTARATVAAAEAALVRARLDLAWCMVTAPIAGRTGALGTTRGNLVTAGQTTLVSIACMQPMRVGFALPAGSLPAVREASGRGPLTVSVVPEGGGQAETGTLDLIENQIDPATGSIRLRATCANADGRLWPNQQCRVELVLGVQAGVVTVPERAVQVGQRGSMVWVVADDMQATLRQVEVARNADGVAVIAKGLEAGERIVLDGQVRLSPGATVVVPEAVRPAKPGPDAKTR